MSYALRIGREARYPCGFAGRVCSSIQSLTVLRATGEMVSSVFAYSLGEPVAAVWKR